MSKMSHIIRITDDQIDDLIYSELEFQRDCLGFHEKDTYAAFSKVMNFFKAPEPKQEVYMYGEYNQLSPLPDSIKYSFHHGI